jgi:Phage integrase family
VVDHPGLVEDDRRVRTDMDDPGVCPCGERVSLECWAVGSQPLGCGARDGDPDGFAACQLLCSCCGVDDDALPCSRRADEHAGALGTSQDEQRQVLLVGEWSPDTLCDLARTSTGGRQSTDNLRSRVIAASVERTNKNLRGRDLPPLPEGITPHSLRRTFASILYAIGEDPGVVMDEMGHTDPALALRVYRQSMRRGEGEKATLRALVEGPARNR